VLTAQRGNPEVVGWNWLSRLPKFDADRCVVMRGLVCDLQNSAVLDQVVQPLAISRTMAGLGYAIAIFSDDYNGKRYLLSAS
jgi:hypothetical protein